MAPSLDCAFSSLLCAEENDAVFDDTNNNEDYRRVVAELEEEGRYQRNLRHPDRRFGVDKEEDDDLSLPLLSDECVALMVEIESQHMPDSNYLDRLRNGDLNLAARKEAVDWISKVKDHFSFGPLCAYLAISYLDRFFSTYELPKGKAWTMQLLAVACLSLAAKLEETQVPLTLDLQVADSKFVFEARTIERMELLVLSTLRWRMQAITPFSFIDSFICKINSNQILPRVSISQSIQLILCIIQGIDFLEFRPSVIAAAVAISVMGETTMLDFEKAFSLLPQHIEKERVLKCIKLIQHSSLINNSVKNARASIPSMPHSPSRVLDLACLSYKSDDKTTGSCVNSTHNSSNNSPQPSTKRRLKRPWEVEL